MFFDFINKMIGEFASFYGVVAYDDENTLFYVTQQNSVSVGYSFLCSPLSFINDNLEGNIQTLLESDFTDNSVLQISLLASPYIHDKLLSNYNDANYYHDYHRYYNDNKLNPLLHNMSLKKLSFLKEHAISSLPNLPTVTRDFKVVISVVTPIKNEFYSCDELEKIKKHRSEIYEALKVMGLQPVMLTDKLFLKVLKPFFNKGIKSSWFDNCFRVDKEDFLAKQLLDFDRGVKIHEDHLEVGGYFVNTYSVKELPESIAFGNALKYAGDMYSGNRGIHVPFIITASILYPNRSKTISSLNAKRAIITHQSYGSMLKFLTKLSLRKQSFDILYNEIDKGDRPVKVKFTISTFCNDKESAEATSSKVRAFYKEQGFTIMPDKYFCLPIFIDSLPMGCDFSSINGQMRYSTMTLRHAKVLLPLFCENKGDSYGPLTLVGRNGQVIGLSLFNSNTNYNLCIAAQSGSGKSFLVNEIITSYLVRKAKIFVIDIGRSYKNICNLFNGNFIAFDNKHRISLNPFTFVNDIHEDLDMLVGIISVMIEPVHTLSSLQLSQLRRIVVELYSRYDKALSIDILADELLNNIDDRISDMGKQLFSFTSKGEYGEFFESTDENSFNNDFVVLELEELNGHKALQKVVLLELIYKILQEMYLGERNVEKLLIIDEAWDLLRDESVANFIESGYRRFRKYNGACITITQSIKDLYENNAGRAIIENSANVYLLGQKEEAIEAIKVEKKLSLSDGEYEALKSVHSLSGVYSEIFAITSNSHLIGRLIVDPLKKIIYSTKPKDVAYVNACLSKGVTFEEMSKQYEKDCFTIKECN